MTFFKNSRIPSQTGNAGKFLKTDGANLSWSTAGGSGSVLSGSSVFLFTPENDTVINTILSASITNSNIKGFSVIPSQTTETSLDDFKLNGLTFNIENIIDGVSFDIRANSINNATGNYTVIYKIIY